MTWTNIYLVCFLLGCSLTVCSWILTMVGGHLPHLHLGAHAHGGSAHAPAASTHAHSGRAGSAASYTSAPAPINFSTLTAFLAWFGGAGYLLTRYSEIWPVVALLVALGVGIAGAALVFSFMANVLWSPNENLDPDDFEVVGLIGTVSSPIRGGGTGEILFQQGGGRCVAGARSENGEPIPKGVEVVITKYEHGLAYVRTWDDLTEKSAQ